MVLPNLDFIGPLILCLLVIGVVIFARKTGADAQKLKALQEIQDAVRKAEAIRRQMDLMPSVVEQLRDEWTKP